MFLVFILLSGAGGVLSAGFAAPAVGVASALTKATQQAFNELPSDFNILEPSQVSVIKASDGTEIAQFYAENRIVVITSSGPCATSVTGSRHVGRITMPELDPRVTAAACEAHDGFNPLNDSAYYCIMKI